MWGKLSKISEDILNQIQEIKYCYRCQKEMKLKHKYKNEERNELNYVYVCEFCDIIRTRKVDLSKDEV